MSSSPGDGEAKPSSMRPEELREDDDADTGVLRMNFELAMAKLSGEARAKLQGLRKTFEDCASVEERRASVRKVSGGG